MPRRRSSSSSSESGRSAARQRKSRKSAFSAFSVDKKTFRYAADCALIGIIFVMPVIMGGRHPLGRLVYVALVTMLTVCSLCESSTDRESSWRKSGVEWLLLGGLAILVLQVYQLPANILQQISPFQSELLPNFSTEMSQTIGLGGWTQISLTPHATWLGMGMFVAHACLLYTSPSPRDKRQSRMPSSA